MMRILIFFFFHFFFSIVVSAACTSPAGVAGAVTKVSSFGDAMMAYCDGSSWIGAEVTDTGVACTTPNVIAYSLARSDLEFCGRVLGIGGYTWKSMRGAALTGFCIGENGKWQWVPGTGMRMCAGMAWYEVGSPPTVLTATPSSYCDVGSSEVIVISQTGGGPAGNISASLGGADPSWFSITGNTCTTLSNGQSCNITINNTRPLPSTWSPQSAVLSVTGSSGGSVNVNLQSEFNGTYVCGI